MRRIPMTFVLGATVLVLAGCSSSSSPTSSSGPPATTPAATTPSTTPTPSATTTATTTTSLDACALVTSSEASTIAGTTFGAGKPETFGGGAGKGCVYGAKTLNVFTVEVAQAADAAAAQAQWDQEQARVQGLVSKQVPAGLHFSLNTAPVSGLGDRAASATASTKISGQTLSLAGIYVLKGAVFFAFQDLALNKTPPTAAAMQAQAQTVLGRVP